MRHRLLAGTVLALALAAPNARAALTDVRVNEFVASNASGLADEDGDFSDWIELYNSGASLVSLSGAYLTDTASNLIKWQLPAVDLDPGAFLIVFASNKNRAIAGAELHTNFRLSQDGEYLGLVAPDGTTVISDYAPTYPAQATDLSYGIGPGGATGYFDPPTPGAPNPPAFVDFVLPVEFSEPHGFYDAPLSVELATATAGAEIRYTTDGSLPRTDHGTVYTAPIQVTATTVLRVRAFKTGVSPSPVGSSTFIFRAGVLTQTGAGFPAEWAGRMSDYEMDQSIVNHPTYGPEMLGALVAIPSVSVLADVDDLFGPTNGIYSHPHGRGDEWTRPVSMEIIYPDGSASLHTNCGLLMHGNSSRTVANPKHSMRLAFKSNFGDPTLNYALFPGSPVTEHRQLVLRAAWQDGWRKARGRALFLRDQFTSNTQLALGQVAARGFYVHLYLNGLYWGVYGLHERATDWFASFYYGGDPDDWDVMKDGKLDEGERTAWDTLLSMTTPDVGTPAGYAAIQQYVDLDNLIDYVMANHYAGNKEWMPSWIAARRRLPGEGFKFFSWDSESTLRSERAIPGLIGRGARPQGVYGMLALYSADFRTRFAQHVQQHYFNGGALTTQVATDRFLALADQLYGPLVAESARWGDASRAGNPYTREDWIFERDKLLTRFFPARSAIVLEKYQRLGLAP